MPQNSSIQCHIRSNELSLTFTHEWGRSLENDLPVALTISIDGGAIQLRASDGALNYYNVSPVVPMKPIRLTPIQFYEIIRAAVPSLQPIPRKVLRAEGQREL